MWLTDATVGPYAFRRGTRPLLLSMPHAGTFVPHAIGRDLHACAVLRPDTDWHLPRLYDFAESLGASIISARVSRYVVDFNRPADGSNLYPGQDTPRLCPIDTFARQPLYRGEEPDAAAIDARLGRYWRPYHRRIRDELDRMRAEHGVAMLWDAHSIAPVVPRLFPGRLPDFNLGTAGGHSCDPGLAEALRVAIGRHQEYTSVLNGRFQGGHITRAYGNPGGGVHAVQLEMSTATYLQPGTGYSLDSALATRLRPVLREQLTLMLDWATCLGPHRQPSASLAR